MKTILERVSFGKLASQPASAGAVCDYCGHATQVGNRMTVRKFAKALQLGQQLQQDFLLNVVSFSALRFAIGAEAQFVANNCFDYRLGVDRDQLRKEFIGLLRAAFGQQRLEQYINLDRRLFHGIGPRFYHPLHMRVFIVGAALRGRPSPAFTTKGGHGGPPLQ
jgi:hypothetical protein